MIALLTNGVTIEYDKVRTIEERAGGKTRTIYQFYRGRVGIVAVIPQERLEKLDCQS